MSSLGSIEQELNNVSKLRILKQKIRHGGCSYHSVGLGLLWQEFFLLGYIIAISLFIAAFMKVRGWRWIVALGSAIVIDVIIYGAFERLLHARLFKGLIWELILS